MIAQYSLDSGSRCDCGHRIHADKEGDSYLLEHHVAALFGIYLVWVPEQATVIAQHVGIGRGTDLVLYIWILISFFSLVVVYLKMNNQFEAITSLARELALTRAEHQYPSDEKIAPNGDKGSPKKKESPRTDIKCVVCKTTGVSFLI